MEPIYTHKGDDFTVQVFKNRVDWTKKGFLFEPSVTQTIFSQDIAEVQISGSGVLTRAKFSLITKDGRNFSFEYIAGGKNEVSMLRNMILNIVPA